MALRQRETGCIGSTPTFLYFDLYLYSVYVAHYVYCKKVKMCKYILANIYKTESRPRIRFHDAAYAVDDVKLIVIIHLYNSQNLPPIASFVYWIACTTVLLKILITRRIFSIFSIFSVKSAKNLRTFWRSTANRFKFLLSSLYSQHTVFAHWQQKISNFISKYFTLIGKI